MQVTLEKTLKTPRRYRKLGLICGLSAVLCGFPAQSSIRGHSDKMRVLCMDFDSVQNILARFSLLPSHPTRINGYKRQYGSTEPLGALESEAEMAPAFLVSGFLHTAGTFRCVCSREELRFLALHNTSQQMII